MSERSPVDGLSVAGVIGAGIALAVCCVVPLLLVAGGAAALSAWLSWLGYGGLAVGILVLALFAGFLWRSRRRGGAGAGARNEGIEVRR